MLDTDPAMELLEVVPIIELLDDELLPVPVANAPGTVSFCIAAEVD